MTPTREKISEFLEVRGAATAEELSRALHVTASNIRYHLSILESEQVVQVIGERPRKERGRPRQIYALTRNTNQHNLDQLASVLLGEMLAGLSPEQQQELLRRLAQRLCGRNPQQKSTTHRLYAAVKRLNELHYQARWEAHAAGPQVILGHCPYITILPEHAELCSLDAYLLEDMLGLPVQQLEKLEINLEGIEQCIFQVKR